MLLKLPRDILSFILSIVVFEEYRCTEPNCYDETLLRCLSGENMFIREYGPRRFASHLRYIRLVHPFLRDMLYNACNFGIERRTQIKCWHFKKTFFHTLSAHERKKSRARLFPLF